MQIKRWLHLPRSLWGILLRYNLFRKRIDQKNFLLSQQISWTVLAVPRSVKYFFAPNSKFLRKSGEEKKERQLRSVLLFKRMQKVKAEIRLPWQNFAKLLSCNSWPPYFSMALIWRCLLKDFSLTMWRFFKGSPNSK